MAINLLFCRGVPKKKQTRRKIPCCFTLEAEDVTWLDAESTTTGRPRNIILAIALELYRQAKTKTRDLTPTHRYDT